MDHRIWEIQRPKIADGLSAYCVGIATCILLDRSPQACVKRMHLMQKNYNVDDTKLTSHGLGCRVRLFLPDSFVRRF